MATSLTQHGITLTWTEDLTVGQYVNGDYYIVQPSGTVTITGGSVASAARNLGATAGRDGITVNPTPGTQGYDDRGTGYSAGANKALSFPFSASAGDSIVIAESADSALAGGSDREYSSGNPVYLETAIVVTVVASAPAANSFRPQYCSGTKTTYAWGDIDTANDLPRTLAFTSGGTTAIARGDTITGATSGSTAVVTGVTLSSGSWAGGDAAGTLYVIQQSAAFQAENLNVGVATNLATIAGDSSRGLTTVSGAESNTTAAARIQRVQLDEGSGWSWRKMHPYQNMPDYGRDIAEGWQASLLTALIDPTGDTSNHDTLVQRLVQLGIDLYGMLQAGTQWRADGGHCYGRLAPIKLAGHLLGVSAMRDIAYTINFAEGGATFYVGASNCPPYTNPDDLGTADWTKDRVTYDPSLTSSYRWIGRVFPGPVLSMAATNTLDSFGHEALPAYVDRYRDSIHTQGGTYAIATFPLNMHNTYWDAFWSAPTPAGQAVLRAEPRV